MLDIPVWKRVLILGVVALGFLYAMPNLFYERVEAHNDAVTAVERNGVATPEDTAEIARWPNWLPSGLVNLGLDLRGGAHLLGEVNVEEVYASRMTATLPWPPELYSGWCQKASVQRAGCAARSARSHASWRWWAASSRLLSRDTACQLPISKL